MSLSGSLSTAAKIEDLKVGGVLDRLATALERRNSFL
jgi:hypothetical protein